MLPGEACHIPEVRDQFALRGVKVKGDRLSVPIANVPYLNLEEKMRYASLVVDNSVR